MADDGGATIAMGLAYLAKQQILATAMQFSVMALAQPRMKDQIIAAMRAMADCAEAECEGLEPMGRAYAKGLRKYAHIIETGEDPDGAEPPADFPFSIIQGGKAD